MGIMERKWKLLEWVLSDEIPFWVWFVFLVGTLIRTPETGNILGDAKGMDSGVRDVS